MKDFEDILSLKFWAQNRKQVSSVKLLRNSSRGTNSSHGVVRDQTFRANGEPLCVHVLRGYNLIVSSDACSRWPSLSLVSLDLGDVMPFKSQAQRRKFAELLLKGEISNQTFEEWNRETGSAKLPERVKPTKRKKSTAKSKAKRKYKPKVKRKRAKRRPQI